MQIAPLKYTSVSSARHDAFLGNFLLLAKVKNTTGKAGWLLDSCLICSFKYKTVLIS